MSGQLFDPTRTSPTACQVPGCQAIRFPNQDKTPTCAHDLDREPAPRPKGCLNAHDPEHAPWPEGF